METLLEEKLIDQSMSDKKIVKKHLDDLLPLFLVDHLDQAALLHHQVVQLVQVKHLVVKQ